MDVTEIDRFVLALEGVLPLRPGPGDGTPEIAWGDYFYYYAPDHVVPPTQPFATVVTKDYPDDTASRLDRVGVFRVNIAAGRTRFVALIGREPRDPAAADEPDPSTSDVLIAHPVYGELGWLSVVDPGPRTADLVRDLLRSAHAAARERRERRP